MGAFGDMLAFGDFRIPKNTTTKHLSEVGEVDKHSKYVYGSRKEMFNSGVAVNEMELAEVPERYDTPMQQIDDLQSYNKTRADNRKVSLATARKLKDTYTRSLPEDIYALMLVSPTEKDYISYMREMYPNSSTSKDSYVPPFNYIPNIENAKKVERTVNQLTFNYFSIQNEDHFRHILMMEESLGAANAERMYELMVEQGDEYDRLLVDLYGNIKSETLFDVEYVVPKMSHYFFSYEEATGKSRKNIKGWKDPNERYLLKTDSYVSAATFVKWKRQQDFVAEISQLYADIDYYNLPEYKHIPKEEMAEIVLLALEKAHIPRPTNIEYSRGFTLKWKISPLGMHRRSQWVEVQERIYKELQKFGADNAVTKDVVRLSRLVGSIHSGTGERVYGHIYSRDAYNFENLFEHLLPERWEEILKSREFAKKLAKQYKSTTGKSKAQKRVSLDGELTARHIRHNYKHIHYLRAVAELVDVRGGNLTGYREIIVFLVRYWQLCLTGNKIKAMNKAKDFYHAMNVEGIYTWDEMEKLSRSAETAWSKWKKDSSKGYNYKVSTLIDLLDITEDEQRKVHYLRSKEIQKERKRDNDREKRPERYQKELEQKGKLTNAQRIELNVETLRKEIAASPSISVRQLAENTGISKSTISRLITKYALK